MVQTKEECLAFLGEARDALDELSLLEEQEKGLSQEETRLFLFLCPYLTGLFN